MIEQTNGATVFTGSDVEVFRMLSLRGMLRLESKGLKSRNPAGLKQAVRDICGSTRKQSVPLLRDYEAYLRTAGIIE